MRDYKHTTIFKSKITILIILITILLCGTIISHASSNTKGNTKSHAKGLKNKSIRKSTEEKMIYCKWIKNKPIVPTTEYKSSWKCETEIEKARKKRIDKLKKDLIGKLF